MCRRSSLSSFGGIAFNLPPKNMFKNRVSTISSRWWPRAILVMPFSAANRYNAPRRSRGQRFAASLLNDLLYRQPRADAMHMVPQQIHHPAELAGGDLLIERWPRRAHRLVELARDHRTQGIRWKIAEMADGPVNVLQA